MDRPYLKLLRGEGIPSDFDVSINYPNKDHYNHKQFTATIFKDHIHVLYDTLWRGKVFLPIESDFVCCSPYISYILSVIVVGLHMR